MQAYGWIVLYYYSAPAVAYIQSKIVTMYICIIPNQTLLSVVSENRRDWFGILCECKQETFFYFLPLHDFVMRWTSPSPSFQAEAENFFPSIIPEKFIFQRVKDINTSRILTIRVIIRQKNNSSFLLENTLKTIDWVIATQLVHAN